jgi:nucleoside-diphosphate kinase
MAIERTFSIIKPDATRRNFTGKINAIFEGHGLRVIAQKRMQLSTAMAEAFYGVHKERPFFRDLVSFMTSGPVVVQVLEGENAVARNRELMGATNPANASEAPSVSSSPRASRRTASTAATAWKTPPSRSPTSSRATRSRPDTARLRGFREGAPPQKRSVTGRSCP